MNLAGIKVVGLELEIGVRVVFKTPCEQRQQNLDTFLDENRKCVGLYARLEHPPAPLEFMTAILPRAERRKARLELRDHIYETTLAKSLRRR